MVIPRYTLLLITLDYTYFPSVGEYFADIFQLVLTEQSIHFFVHNFVEVRNLKQFNAAKN